MTDSIDRSRSIPDGWHTVTPRLVVREPQQLVEFIRYVFGATGEHRPDRPTVLRIGDSQIMISAADMRDPAPAFLYVYVGDTNGTYQRALDAGARSLEKPSNVPMEIVGAWLRTSGAILGRSPRIWGMPRSYALEQTVIRRGSTGR